MTENKAQAADYNRRRRAKLTEDSRCVSCTRPLGDRAEDYKLCEPCCEDRRSHAKAWAYQRRSEVLHVYGGKCVCCGETERTMLQLDHVNNDGATMRRKLKTCKMEGWIIENDFPDCIQILCANCNMSKYQNGGVCAHGNQVHK